MLGLRGSDQRVKRKEKNFAQGGKWAALISWIIEPMIADSIGNNEQYFSTAESLLRESDQTDYVLHSFMRKLIHHSQNSTDVQLALVRKRFSVHSIAFTELDNCNLIGQI